MELDKILVIIFGGGLIAFIYWFFFGKKDEVIDVNGDLNIIVEGGYKPETIRVPLNTETTISFYRKDPSSCLEEVVLPEFKIKKYLPLNEKVSITLKPKKAGTYRFQCGMNMYHGKLIVK